MKRSSQIYSLQQFPMSNCLGNLGQACTKTPSGNVAFGEIPDWTEQVVFSLLRAGYVRVGCGRAHLPFRSDVTSHSRGPIIRHFTHVTWLILSSPFYVSPLS